MIQQQVLDPVLDDTEREELAEIASEMQRLSERLRSLCDRKDALQSRSRLRPMFVGEVL